RAVEPDPDAGGPLDSHPGVRRDRHHRQLAGLAEDSEPPRRRTRRHGSHEVRKRRAQRRAVATGQHHGHTTTRHRHLRAIRRWWRHAGLRRAGHATESTDALQIAGARIAGVAGELTVRDDRVVAGRCDRGARRDDADPDQNANAHTTSAWLGVTATSTRAVRRPSHHIVAPAIAATPPAAPTSFAVRAFDLPSRSKRSRVPHGVPTGALATLFASLFACTTRIVA